MSAQGVFTFVLHSHLPYARLAGRWPHGEEWIHEAASETYVPLLEVLYDLREAAVPYKLTLGVTPVLCEQLADATVQEHFEEYLHDKIAAAERDMDYYAPSSQHGEQEPHLHELARWYRDFYRKVQQAFVERFNRDILAALRVLQDEGYIEIFTSAATHAYLPLLSRDSALEAQIRAGVASYERYFGRKPRGFWLPECAYRPAYHQDDGLMRPGLEAFIARHGLKYFFSETHAITGGSPVGVAAGDVIGPYGEVKRRYVIPANTQEIPRRAATTYAAYYVSDSASGAEAQEHSGVAVLGRNNNTGQQVWSAEWGYPGDFDYREFHKKAGTSGLQYWRVTGAKVDLSHKDYYHPDWAFCKVEQHAEHFAHLVGDLLRDYHNHTGRPGIVCSNYDAELFGHWWFEGVRWLGEVLNHIASDSNVDMMTISEYLEAFPPEEVLHLPEGSWGVGGNHFTWDNGENHWMWPPLHDCELRMEQLAQQYQSPSEAERAVLNQAARELMLAQSSDWPFLVTTGQAREYAIQRYSQHIERFKRLAESLEQDQPDVGYAEEMWQLDKIFSDLDYTWFRPVVAEE